MTVSLLVSQYLLRKEKSADAARTAFGSGAGAGDGGGGQFDDDDVEASTAVSSRVLRGFETHKIYILSHTRARARVFVRHTWQR